LRKKEWICLRRPGHVTAGLREFSAPGAKIVRRGCRAGLYGAVEQLQAGMTVRQAVTARAWWMPVRCRRINTIAGPPGTPR